MTIVPTALNDEATQLSPTVTDQEGRFYIVGSYLYHELSPSLQSLPTPQTGGVFQPTTPDVFTLVLGPGETHLGPDFGFQVIAEAAGPIAVAFESGVNYSVTGTVFEDSNENGTLDPGERGFAGMGVRLARIETGKCLLDQTPNGSDFC